MTFLLETMRLGIKNLRLHLLRSLLTALGIIFGIAAVILITAIAEGSKQAALREFEILGARNVILRSIRPAEQDQMTGGSEQRTWVSSFGLTRQDFRRLESTFGSFAETIVPLKAVGSQVTRGAWRMKSQTFGTTPELPGSTNYRVSSGRYLSVPDMESSARVCVIGSNVVSTLFRLEDPLDKIIRVDSVPFRVVGVMKPVGLAGGKGAALVGRELNSDVHIPMTTAEANFGDVIMQRSSGQRDNTRVEVSEVYITMKSLSEVMEAARLARRTVQVNHPRMSDVEVIVPHELIEQATRTAKIWQRVMVAFAATALLVGGIGIMNIMLASVTERTREIGIRRALGATQAHIIWQFLVETGVLSMLGGVIGIGLGVGCARALAIIPATRELFPTDITGWSIIVSFVVACGVGLVFGLYPARMAAAMDPIVALRHD